MFGRHIEISERVDIYNNAVYENGWVGTEATAPNSAGIYFPGSSGTEVRNNLFAWNRDGIAFIGSPRHADSTNNRVFANDIVMGSDPGGKMLAAYWNANGSDLAGSGGNDNRYWFPSPEDTRKRFQWNSTQYDRLTDYNATLGEENGRYLTNEEKNVLLNAESIPQTPEH